MAEASVISSVHGDHTCARGSAADGASTRASRGARLARVSRRRARPLLVAAVSLVTGLAFVFFWPPAVEHIDTWFNPWDVWGIFRGAHYVAWGDLGGIYNSETGIVAFPGMSVLLAPVAMLSDSLHLTSSIGTTLLVHPTADFLLIPVELFLASTVVFAADALAEELDVPRRRRWVLCAAVGALAWTTAALWGHAEDSLAMTFALSAMLAVRRERWTTAGWCFGIGIVLQPLVALVIPLYLAASPRGGRILFAVRCAVLSVFLVGVAFVGNPAGTFRSLVEQPTPAGANHTTPWIAWSPRVAVPADLSGGGRFVWLQHQAGGLRTVVHAARPHLDEVAGGPGRTIYVVAAVLLGLYVWRRPQSPDRLLWLAGAVLAGRCCFEAVMTPYYVVPPLVLLLVLAARAGRRRFVVAVAVAAGMSYYGYEHLAPWVWWTPIVTGLVVLLVLSHPRAVDTGSGVGPGGAHPANDVPFPAEPGPPVAVLVGS